MNSSSSNSAVGAPTTSRSLDDQLQSNRTSLDDSTTATPGSQQPSSSRSYPFLHPADFAVVSGSGGLPRSSAAGSATAAVPADKTTSPTNNPRGGGTTFSNPRKRPPQNW